VSVGAAPGPALARLAALHGIATSYRRTTGETVVTPRESVVALLGLLGVSVGSERAANAAAAAERARRSAVTLDAVLVHRGPGAPVISFTPRRALGAGAELVVTQEDGDEQRYPLSSLEAPTTRARRRAVRLPGEVPLGVHRIALVSAGLCEQATLLVAPAALPRAERGWGAFTPTYALRGASDLGAGTLGDLAALSRLLAERGAALVATLPLYAARESPTLETSPYLPLSRLAWNGLYLDLTPLVAATGDEQLRCEHAAALLGAADDKPTRVRYDEVLARRAPLLGRLAALAARDPAGRAAIDAFYAARPELAAYCSFRARHDLAATPPAGADVQQREAYHRYLQFALDRQLDALAGEGPGLLLDFPIGVHPEGFDTAAFPESFTFGANVGAPPDPFQAAGQDWGFPPPSPTGQRTEGYRYLRACLRAAFSYAKVLRIDHVMAFERLWWIPAGAPATEGAYVASPTEELHALVAIEAARAGAVVVGEDLGTVSATTERAMDDEAMLHSSILQFTLRADAPLPEPPARAVASVGTHDLPRFAAFWRGDDLDPGDTGARTARAALRNRVADALGLAAEGSGTDAALTSPETTRAALRGLLGHLARSPADLVVCDLEDAFLEEQPINRPGTEDDGNWSLRSGRTLAELANDPTLAALFEHVDAERRR